MKRITTTLIALLVLSVLTAGLATAATITVRTDPWPPYTDEPGDKPGYMTEVAEAIFTAKGHTVDYQIMPWSRALDAVQKGTYDAVFGTDRDESPDFVFPEQALGVNQNGFYVKKGNSWKYTGGDSFKGVRVGVIDGYGYFPELDSYLESYKGKKLFVATGDDALPKLLKMLKAGRVDAVIDNMNVMAVTLEENNLADDIVLAGSVDDVGPLYMAFTPAKDSSKDYSKMFDDGLAELRSSGKLQEILSRYGLKDWK
jgi:polar amino acid transport system substrate-binding protein